MEIGVTLSVSSSLFLRTFSLREETERENESSLEVVGVFKAAKKWMASTFIPRGCRRSKQREAVEAEAATIAAAASSRDDKKWKRSFSADRCYPTAFLTATLLDQKLAKPWKAIFSVGTGNESS